MTHIPLASRNQSDLGFLGTMRRAGQDPAAAWELASRLIVEATACTPEAVRDFLDGHQGRQFGFRILIELAHLRPLQAAIEEVVLLLSSKRVESHFGSTDGITIGPP